MACEFVVSEKTKTACGAKATHRLATFQLCTMHFAKLNVASRRVHRSSPLYSVFSPELVVR